MVSNREQKFKEQVEEKGIAWNGIISRVGMVELEVHKLETKNVLFSKISKKQGTNVFKKLDSLHGGNVYKTQPEEVSQATVTVMSIV